MCFASNHVRDFESKARVDGQILFCDSTRLQRSIRRQGKESKMTTPSPRKKIPMELRMLSPELASLTARDQHTRAGPPEWEKWQ